MRGTTNVMPQAETMSHAAAHYADGSDPIDLAKLGAIPATDKGKKGGVATLGEDGKVPSGQLPAPTSVDFNILDNFPTAEVGQLLRVAAVDENGNPTAWEMAEALNTDMSNLNETADLSALASALGASKVVTGTYVGSGTVGQSNPNKLTFDFEVKFLWIYLFVENTASNKNYYRTNCVVDKSLSGAGLPWNRFYGSGMNNNGAIFFTFSGSTVSWYGQAYSSNQLNDSGCVYHYIAIG